MMEPHEVWHSLPAPLRSVLRATPAFDFGRALNDQLWRTDTYVRWRYDFEWVPVRFDDFEMAVYAPTGGRPLWREYDRYGCHEPLTSRALVDVLTPGDTFWDLGSRLGYFSTLAATATGHPEGVHVFETSPASWRVVEENNRVQFDGAMAIVNAAVGTGHDGTLSGDRYAAVNGPPDVVKMDIEGAELEALQGMEDVLSTHQPTLIVEGHPELLGEDSSDDDQTTDEALLELLRRYYDAIRISFDFRHPDGHWAPVEERWADRFDAVDVAAAEHDYYQLLCRPQS
jgi:hypothetical protein